MKPLVLLRLSLEELSYLQVCSYLSLIPMNFKYGQLLKISLGDTGPRP